LDISDKELKVLDLELRGVNSALTFSPNGKLFSSVVFNPARNGELYGSEIKTWKVAADRSMTEYSLLQLQHGFKTLAYSPDGNWMATGGLEKVVRIWDLRPDLPVEKAQFPMKQWVKAVYFAGSSDYVVGVGSSNQIVLFNVARGAVEKEWNFTPRRESKFGVGAMSNLFSTMHMAPDGRHLAFGNHTAQTMILRLPIPAAP
jgi:WD40 repeat protein